MTKDPVCYRDLDEMYAAQQGLFSEREGRRFFFCSVDCKTRFDESPGSYAMRVSDWHSEAEEPTTENYIG